MSAQQKPVVGSELHPLSILRMLWKRKLTVGLVWIVGSVTAAGIVLKLPPVYKSEALIVVESQKIPDRYVASTVSSEISDRIATIGEQIMSSTQLKKIIDDFGLYKEQRGTLTQEEILDKMKADTTVQIEKGWTSNRPGAFRVGFQGPDPSTVSQVANRLANLYIEENLKVREVQAEGTSEFMETQLTDAKKRLDELETAVSQYKLKHNGELPQQETSISSELARESLALQSNRGDIRRAEESRKILQDTLGIAEATATALAQPQPGSGAAAPNTMSGPAAANPQPVHAPDKRSDLFRARLQAYHDAGYKDGHPDVKIAKEQLAAAVQEELKEEATSSKKPAAGSDQARPAQQVNTPAPIRAALSFERERGLEQTRERVVSLKSQIEALGREIQDRNTEQQKLQQNISILQSRLGNLPIREQEMASLTRDYEISKSNYKSLLDKKTSAEMSTDMERRQKSERFTLLDPARVPEKPSKPNRPLFEGLGCALALALGLVMGFGLEMRQNCLLGEWELPKEVIILGRVPVIAPMLVTAPGQVSGGTNFRKWRVGLGLASVFLLAVLAAGFYVVRTRF
jgi:succinoglycan biosynthesis transport protein ExoP